MDNNKVVDKVNFIKIYFRVFIYKIIVLKWPELSKKEMKNHRWRMKTCLGTRTGQKTLEEESKWHPNKKECLVSKGQYSTFRVLNGTLKVPNCHHVGFGPMAFGWRLCIPFSIFHKRMQPDSNPNHSILFFRVFWPL